MPTQQLVMVQEFGMGRVGSTGIRVFAWEGTESVRDSIPSLYLLEERRFSGGHSSYYQGWRRQLIQTQKDLVPYRKNIGVTLSHPSSVPRFRHQQFDVGRRTKGRRGLDFYRKCKNF